MSIKFLSGKSRSRLKYQISFCYDSSMPLSLRRFAAYLLLVLLPLQAFASVGVTSCAERMPHCPGMQASGNGCCDHGVSIFGSSTDHGAHSGAIQPDMSPCAGANTCAPVMTVAAVLPSVSLVAVLPAEETWRLPDLSFYLSFIPDGLHRPPSSLA